MRPDGAKKQDRKENPKMKTRIFALALALMLAL